MDEQKQQYSEICANAVIPIFSQPWWLDIAAGNKNWDVRILSEKGVYQAALPFVTGRIGPFHVIRMPRLTPNLHIWLNRPDNQSSRERLAFEKESLTQLIMRLPDVMRFYQKYSYEFQNWLPFYWQGYSQTTRYSNIIDPVKDVEQIFEQFKKNTRYDIRKARKQLQVQTCDDVNRFLEVNRLSFQRQSKSASYTDELVRKIDSACAARSDRKMLMALDEGGHVHAAVYLVQDTSSVYYLMGGADPVYRGSGANALLIWEAIQYAVNSGRRFDFEGSMMEPIEFFFRSFNPRQQPYFAIKKSKFPVNLIDGMI